MHAGAVVILVLALDTAAALADSHQEKVANLSCTILCQLLNSSLKISEEIQLALLQMQAVPRFCKLLQSYITVWTSHVPLNATDGTFCALLEGSCSL